MISKKVLQIELYNIRKIYIEILIQKQFPCLISLNQQGLAKQKSNTRAKQKTIQNGNDEQQNITQEHEFTYWDSSYLKYKTIKFQITFTKEKKIKHTKDGQILRTDQVLDSFQKPEIFNNLEQINNLKWSGQYGQNSLKVDRWTADWNNETIQEVGGYYSQCGQKQGLWKDLSKNYWRQNLHKFLKWGSTLIIKEAEFGGISTKIVKCGGSYDEQGEKNGKWLELSDNFWNQSQVIYEGEYKSGKKFGLWNVLYIGNGQRQLKQIACGLYNQIQDKDEIVDSIKVGKWIELNDRFWDLAQVLLIGDYKNGRKVGRWDTLHRIRNNKPFEIIGGGSYDKNLEGDTVSDSLKICKWIELSEGFWRDSQITYNGEYQMDIYYFDDDAEKIQLIGGGSFVEKINDQNLFGSVKTGIWIELSDGFKSNSEVTYKGEYENGKKVGRWNIFYKDDQMQQLLIFLQIKFHMFCQSGGGQYEKLEDNHMGDSIKVGKWIEQIQGFYEYGQVLYCGEYLNGKKVSIWYQMFGENILDEENYLN
ncbi:unnamed protein product [Paramecium primaurelia]|uniref:Uncharacterized protein n=1 Tax=Paramecium primaurelia TaxID=5886 RepID=A0A8S1N9L7_PARPR|nr:unnamed protein product [Paramecium primaurelia]